MYSELTFNILYHPFVFDFFFFFFNFTYFREGKGERKGKTYICGCFSCAPYWGPGPLPGMYPDWESNWDPLVLRPALNPLRHTSQGWLLFSLYRFPSFLFLRRPFIFSGYFIGGWNKMKQNNFIVINWHTVNCTYVRCTTQWFLASFVPMKPSPQSRTYPLPLTVHSGPFAVLFAARSHLVCPQKYISCFLSLKIRCIL